MALGLWPVRDSSLPVPLERQRRGIISAWAIGPGIDTTIPRGLKARTITRADGSGLQPSRVSMDPAPWALPKAGMERAFSPEEFLGR